MSSRDSSEFGQTQTDPGSGEPALAGDVPGLPNIDPAAYELRDELGRGGMGRVIRARDRRLGRDVALKELIEAAPGTRERFIREARITARLQHPAIVPIYEAAAWPNGEPFYAMKLVSGVTLTQKICDATTQPKRMALLRELHTVAEAVSYAHSQGVIHRDLKSSNVIVGPFGQTLVVDWGLAKELDRDDGALDEPNRAKAPELTRVGAVVGTPAFMSPEQALGHEVDAATDVFALGAVLFHILTGAPPYVAESSDAVLEKARAGAPPPLPKGTAPELIAIYRRATSRRPEQRYASAAEFAGDLRSFQEGRLVGAHDYSLWLLVQRWFQRHRLLVSLSALFAIILFSLGIVALRGIVSARGLAEERRAIAEQQKTIANSARADAEHARDDATIARARTLLRVDPTESLAIVKSLDRGLLMQPDVQALAEDAVERGVALHVLIPNGTTVDSVGLLGERIALVNSRDRLRAFDVVEQTEIKLDIPPARQERRPGAFVDTDQRIQQLHVAGGRAFLLSSYQQLGSLEPDVHRPGRIVQHWVELPHRYHNNQEFNLWRHRLAVSPLGSTVATAEQNDTTIRNRTLEGVRVVDDSDSRVLVAGETHLGIVDGKGVAWLVAPDGRRTRLSKRGENLLDHQSREFASLFRSALAVAPDGSAAAYVVQRDTLNSELTLVQGARRSNLGVAVEFQFSTRGELIWIEGDSVNVLEPGTGTRTRWNVPTSSKLSRLAISSDGSTLAVGDAGGAVFVRRRSDEAWRSRLGPPSPLSALAVSDHGNLVISGDVGGQVRVWEVTGPQQSGTVQRCELSFSFFQTFDVDLKSRSFIAGCPAEVRIGSLDDDKVTTVMSEPAYLRAVDIHSSGTRAIVSTLDRLRVLSLERNERGRRLDSLEVNGIACFAGDHRVFLGDGGIYEWKDGVAHRLLDSAGGIRCADSSTVVAAMGKRESPPGTIVEVLNLDTGESWSKSVSLENATLLALSDDGATVVVANERSAMAVSADNHAVVVEGASTAIKQIAVSPKGRVVATVGWGGLVSQYNLETGGTRHAKTGFAMADVLRYGADGRLRVFSERGYTTLPSLRIRGAEEMATLLNETDADLDGGGEYVGFSSRPRH